MTQSKVSSFLCVYELSAEELMACGEGWNGRYPQKIQYSVALSRSHVYYLYRFLAIFHLYESFTNNNIISSILIELFISHHTCTENEYEPLNVGISIIFYFLHYMTIGNLSKIRSTFGPRPQGFLLALSRSC